MGIFETVRDEFYKLRREEDAELMKITFDDLQQLVDEEPRGIFDLDESRFEYLIRLGLAFRFRSPVNSTILYRPTPKGIELNEHIEEMEKERND